MRSVVESLWFYPVAAQPGATSSNEVKSVAFGCEQANSSIRYQPFEITLEGNGMTRHKSRMSLGQNKVGEGAWWMIRRCQINREDLSRRAGYQRRGTKEPGLEKTSFLDQTTSGAKAVLVLEGD